MPNSPMIRSVSDEAYRYCASHGIDFEKHWSEYVKNYYILKGPDYLLMARPLYAPKEAWFIFLAIGDNCFRVWHNCMPFYLPNVAFCRFGRGSKKVRYIGMKQFERFL